MRANRTSWAGTSHDYIKLPLDIIPEEIIQQYNLKNLEHKSFVYIEIQKGLYGLPQSLKIHIFKFRSEPSPITPCMWWHQTRPLQLSLVVDNFGVKYELQEGITHLPDALKTI